MFPTNVQPDLVVHFNFCLLFTGIITYFSVLTVKISQRFCISNLRGFDFSDKNSVIASVIRMFQTTFKIDQTVFQHR